MLNEKIIQAVHYICHTAQGLPLGAVRLNKILWFAEKECYLRTLQPMFGITFVKGPFGPMPPDAQKACRELVKRNALEVRNRCYGSYSYMETKSLYEPDTSALSEDELKSLRDLIWEICTEHSSRSISDLTHNSVYAMLDMGEVYPLELALVENARPATEEEIAILERVAAEEEGILPEIAAV